VDRNHPSLFFVSFVLAKPNKDLHGIGMDEHGFIELIMGCMSSEKTMELLRLYFRATYGRKRYALFRHAQENTFSKTAVVSRSGLSEDRCIHVHSISEIGNHLFDIENGERLYDIIFIDEGQFYDGLAKNVVQWANKGYHIYISALDAYATGVLWPEIAKLIPWADKVVKLTAVCSECGENATLTKDLLVTDTTEPQVVFARDERFRACCRKCILRENPEKYQF
jgi:thymidine kinase